jgi:hypothetical protein
MEKERSSQLNTGQKTVYIRDAWFQYKRPVTWFMFSSSPSVQSELADINSGANNCYYRVSVRLLHRDCQAANHCSWLSVSLILQTS